MCYVMLCYVMLCYVMLCYVMLCYVMLCYVVLCYIILCYVLKFLKNSIAMKKNLTKVRAYFFRYNIFYPKFFQHFYYTFKHFALKTVKPIKRCKHILIHRLPLFVCDR